MLNPKSSPHARGCYSKKEGEIRDFGGQKYAKNDDFQVFPA
jgi:hypothetical protein